MKKIKYSVDASGRLVIKPAGKKAQTVDGAFSVDKTNQLIYRLNAPLSWRREYGFTDKIVFNGSWQLNQNHGPEFILSKTKGLQEEEKLTLRGWIISAEPNALVFEIKSVNRRGLSHIRLIKLSGTWQADNFNRLSFQVEKKVSPDTLIFEGKWHLNKNQQIIYTYERTALKTRQKTKHALLFSGFWQINRANRLVYILSRSSNSGFDFRAQIESPNLYPQAGRIKYRLGAGIRKEALRSPRLITLYGAWKFSRKYAVSFVMDYGKEKMHAIEFNTEFNISKKREIILSLQNNQNKSLGITLTLTHKFLKGQGLSGSEAFLRFKAGPQERAVEAGARVLF